MSFYLTIQGCLISEAVTSILRNLGVDWRSAGLISTVPSFPGRIWLRVLDAKYPRWLESTLDSELRPSSWVHACEACLPRTPKGSCRIRKGVDSSEFHRHLNTSSWLLKRCVVGQRSQWQNSLTHLPGSVQCYWSVPASPFLTPSFRAATELGRITKHRSICLS